VSNVVIQLVTWNGKKYIPYLFESLRKQTYQDVHLYVFDNGSTDGTPDAIEKELMSVSFTHTLVKNEQNVGFVGGHNEVYNIERSPYVLLLNQDMYLMPDSIETMVKFLDTHEKVGSVSPRLMRWNFADIEYGLEASFTDMVDALGLRVFRNRRVVDKYAGYIWEEKKKKVGLSFRVQDTAVEVFGVSGALPMYRRSALETVQFSDNTFFDGSYQSYKEDVDLAYRLRIAGFNSYVLLNSVAYHDRTATGFEFAGDRFSVQNKKKQSEWVRFHSYKNHLATIYKNEYWQNFILDFPWIIWYELKKLAYFTLFDRTVLTGFSVLWRNRSLYRKRRKEVRAMRKISWKELRQWLQ